MRSPKAVVFILFSAACSYILLSLLVYRTAASSSVASSYPSAQATEQTYPLTDLPMLTSQASFGPVEINQSIGGAESGDGGPLTINGQVFSQGIGTHAASLIAYDLQGKCSIFSAAVGVDDSAGNGGSVIFQVMANQTIIFDSGVMTGADDAKPTGALSVSGVRELLLIVRANGDDYTNDFANWVNPTVSCTSQPNGDGSSFKHIRGSWEPVMEWPVKAIHASLLPSGHLLTHASAEVGSVGSDDPTAPHNMTKVDLSDIETWSHQWVDHDSEEMYCSAHTLLEDGRVFEIGGHGGADFPPNREAHYYGQDQASTFTFSTLQWNAEANMSQARWYPTAVTLGNGDVMAIGGAHAGGNTFLPEIWDGTSWRTLANASYEERINNGELTNDHNYPFVHLLSDGQLFWSGWDENMAYLDPTGNGSWGPNYFREARQRAWGAPVMYQQDKILLAGGIDHQGNYGKGTRTAVTIDLTGNQPDAAQTGAMLFARADADGTILANGEVFVNGGGYQHVTTSSPYHYYVPEIWNPDTGEWRVGAAATHPRGYHSTSLLLPDGRVWTGGGDCGLDCPFGKTAQIYSPPYLFGNIVGGRPETRPIIASAPSTIEYNQTVSVNVATYRGASKVTLLRLGSTTHTYNFEQRYLELVFSLRDSNLSFTTPANGNVAPPGHYMLFVLDDNGVPSVAKIVRLTELSNQPTAVSVCASGGDYATIQAGIDAVATGGTVDICAGTFPENISINKSLTLLGAGIGSTIIKPANYTTVLIASGHTVAIEDLSITTAAPIYSDVDPIRTGAGIENSGSLTLRRIDLYEHDRGIVNRGGDVTVIDSQIRDNAFFISRIDDGIGIYNNGGTLRVENSLITRNRERGADEEYNDGGGIYNDGVATIVDSIIRENEGRVGAGIFNRGDLTIERSRIVDNSASMGGGIANFGTLLVDTVTIRGNTIYGDVYGGGCSGGAGILNGEMLVVVDSLIAANLAPFSPERRDSECVGGGIHNRGTNADVKISNTTISQNRASCNSFGCYGGGVGNTNGASMQLTFVTLYDNENGGIYNQSTSSQPASSLTLSNSIVAGSTGASDCQNVNSTITSAGYNIDSDGSCGLSDTGDQSNLAPLLGLLQDNGGPTETLALLEGSPAIDAGDNTNCLATDQRGVARPQGPACDIGAFELEGGSVPTPTPVPPTPTPTPPSPTCGPLQQEAETGTLFGDFEIGNDTSASSGQYIHVPEESAGDEYDGPNPNRRVDYCFTVPTTGTYAIKGIVYGTNGSSDSFYVKVNDAPASGYGWDTNRDLYNAYVLDYVNDRFTDADPVLVSLTAGEHELSIFLREDGARLDTIELEPINAPTPTPVPPTPTPTPAPPTPTPLPTGCGSLTQEGEDGTLFGKFAIGDDPNASGGQYVSVPKRRISAAGLNALNINRKNRADYCVTVTEAGEYRLRVQVMAPDHRSNSFLIQVDGMPTNGTLYDIFPADGSYVTDYVTQRGVDDPMVYSLEPGDHTISFIRREDGARLDSFTLESVSVQAARVTEPTEVELRENLAAEGEVKGQDINIFVPLITQ